MASRPLLIAHRGASAYAPDNTLEAIAIAVEQDADGVELDVRFTADDVVVLSHDAVITGVGPVVAATFSQLRAAHPSIARLEDVLAVAGHLLLNVEVKNDPADPDYDPEHRMAEAVAAWVDISGTAARSLITSFNPVTARRIRELAPNVETGLLVDHRRGVGAVLDEAAGAGHGWVLPRRTAFLPHRRGFVRKMHERGLRAGTWTVNRPAEIRAFARAGIDAIITNDPAGARAAID